MINLAFGGKLIHGGADVGSILPTDKDCNHNVRAKSMEHALGPATLTHGDLFQSPAAMVFAGGSFCIRRTKRCRRDSW